MRVDCERGEKIYPAQAARDSWLWTFRNKLPAEQHLKSRGGDHLRMATFAAIYARAIRRANAHARLRRFGVAATMITVLFLVSLARPTLGGALFTLAGWYIMMSAFDWWTHKYVMHNDASIVKSWRHAHYIHHREFDGAFMNKTGASLTFPHSSALVISLVTLPIALVLGVAWTTRPVPLLAITFAHLAACMLFIGAHNYAHSHFHDYVPPSWSRAPCTPVPRAMREYLHEHHERHHSDARTNLCTILLGFDYLAGTVYEVPVGLPEPSSEVAGEAALFAPPPSKLAPAAAAGDAPDFGMQLNELLQGLPAPAPAARLQRSKSPMRPGRVLHPCL